ncbi:hypothetical protein F0562_012182 [Nyssa sinensis]|uniref:THO1-MOS11 C-terminal domain-containing protein n=1 Tax=Nyssa sinensis TaxID=561372 RepID=A0A5J4ZUY6_9ASTE|nr:hypothetical protein F0562_012182 [Nyssa sinensis]
MFQYVVQQLAVPTTRDEYLPNNTTSSTLQQLSTTAKDGDESKIVGDSLETGDPVGSTAANENSNDAPVSNIQKKIRRAERFGMPVQLSEEEKRNSRAERKKQFMHGLPQYHESQLPCERTLLSIES